jgi:glycosyltransferase involved in cell wall biosynthesis
MRRIFDKYKDKVRFVLFGNISGISEEFIKDTYERHDFIGLDTYPLKLASLNLDIAICPLENIDFNRAKSQLKWSEMAALKVPSVCSKIEAYDCVEDGITGLVADNETEFYEKICELVDSGKFRQEIAQNAYDKNYEDYNLEKNAVLWVEAYEQTRDSCESQLSEWGVSEKGTPKISQILDTK